MLSNRFMKLRGYNNAPSNKSMDVRRKQLLSFNGFSLSLGLREGGFRPRHLNRSMLSC